MGTVPVLHRRSVRLRLGLVLALAALVSLMSGVAAAWWDDAWTLKQKISLDTTATGAALVEPVERMPVLIRLHDGVFPFTSALPAGEDLRIVSGDEMVPLTYHIEKFDALVGTGLVWVDLPAVPANAVQDLWLYYGNAQATAAADPAGTYDEATVLVYNFADVGVAPQDSTRNGNHAAGPGLVSPAGQIGQGLKFDGRQLVDIPANPSLAFGDGAEVTLSLWAKLDTAQPDAVLLSRRFGASALLVGVDGTSPFVEVATAAGPTRIRSGFELTEARWHHLAVTARPGELTLYVDGRAAGAAAVGLPGLGGAITLGGDPYAPQPAAAEPAAAEAPAGAIPGAPPGGTGAAAVAEAPPPAVAGPVMVPFLGEIDELRIARTARSAAYIAAVTASEGAPPKLAVVDPAQETSGWFDGGYMVIILQSVTIDGWVVIAMLFIFSVVSWVVMVSKTNLVSRLEKANRAFRATFDPVANDLDLLDELEPELMLGGGQPLPPQLARQLHRSPLYHLFVTAADEVRGRFGAAATARPGRLRVLSPQMLAAIRARLDGRMVRESQHLNSSMVMLTMAIAGGPFLGLLGTCIGVMITFAGIAAIGEVNINAIAPGVAAALTATVAGLAVAIPALFGYNFLLIKIKSIQADMQVFVDEMVTRLAETYSPDREPRHERLAAE